MVLRERQEGEKNALLGKLVKSQLLAQGVWPEPKLEATKVLVSPSSSGDSPSSGASNRKSIRKTPIKPAKDFSKFD